jgi:hypothetical protein
MKKNSVSIQALWFITLEQQRIIANFRSGVIGQEQAIGGLNTLYQMASEIKDVDTMKSLCMLTSKIRTAEHTYDVLDPVSPPQRIG